MIRFMTNKRSDPHDGSEQPDDDTGSSAPGSTAHGDDRPATDRTVDESTRLVLVAGTTGTARIEGISAAGATPDATAHTPSADAEVLAYGRLVRVGTVPVSPTGCPTPAAVTRAVHELVDLHPIVVDGGLSAPTAAPTVSVGARSGRDVREPDPVPTAPGTFEAARRYGRRLPVEHLVVGETIPGGTTTALGVARALGESIPVSSSLPDNPLELKRRVVDEALAASDLAPGQAAHAPELAVRFAGDPVLAAVSGLVAGALEAGTRVTLGGGTQLLAAAALVRHAGREGPLTLATTSYLAADVPDLEAAAARLDVDVTVTDPGFAVEPLARYAAGEAKEGAGMGGALALAAEAGVLDAVPGRTIDVLDRLGTGDPEGADGS
jgi:uncharacterized protein (TIGR00303 family)